MIAYSNKRKLTDFSKFIIALLILDAILMYAMINQAKFENIVYHIAQFVLLICMFKIAYGIYLRKRGTFVTGYLCDIDEMKCIYTFYYEGREDKFTAQRGITSSRIELSVLSGKKVRHIYDIKGYMIVGIISAGLILRSKDVHNFINRILDSEVPDFNINIVFWVESVAKSLIYLSIFFGIIFVYKLIKNFIIVSTRKKVQVKLVKRTEEHNIVTSRMNEESYSETMSVDGIALYRCNLDGKIYYIAKEYHNKPRERDWGYASYRNYENVIFTEDKERNVAFLKAAIIFFLIGIVWETGYLSKILDALDEIWAGY